MNTLIPTPRPASRCPAPGGLFPAVLRVPGHALSLAGDLDDLEACLALERAKSPLLAAQGIHSPQAVPYCDFLMLRGPGGRLVAAARLMRLDGGNPIPNPLATERFQLSPLLTALRYSREGILEMGAPSIVTDMDPVKAARLLWTGMAKYLERNGLAFVIGLDALPALGEGRPEWPRLMAAHGLPPDLETETRPGFRAIAPAVPPYESALSGDPLRFWPPGLQEALLRGCRLACEPAWNPACSALEFVWVASRDMLADGEGDWRGAGG